MVATPAALALSVGRRGQCLPRCTLLLLLIVGGSHAALPGILRRMLPTNASTSTLPPLQRNDELLTALPLHHHNNLNLINDNVTVVSTTSKSESTPLKNEASHGVPGNPTEVIAIAYDARAELMWHAPLDDGLDPILSYEIATFLNDGDDPLEGHNMILSNPLNATTLLPTTTIISALVNGEAYAFKVRAANRNGASTWSAKSAPISPLHPADLCTHVTCSGHGACFPNYVLLDNSARTVNTTTTLNHNRQVHRPLDDNTAVESNSHAVCVCDPWYATSRDCSVKSAVPQGRYTTSPWSACSAGCGGGIATRDVSCRDPVTMKPVPESEAAQVCHTKAVNTLSHVSDAKPLRTRMCNTMACGVHLVDATLALDMGYDKVLFSASGHHLFHEAFVTEMAAALKIEPTRLFLKSVTRGSIVVRLLVLPPIKDTDAALDAIIESLQSQLADPTSALLTTGTFVRHVNPTSLKMSFFIAEVLEANAGEDISVAGLIGTVAVLVGFITGFASCLKRRHARLMLASELEATNKHVAEATSLDLKPMGIKST